MVGRGLIDISFVNPFIYVKLADRFDARPLVRVVEPSGQLNFRGQIICRADNAHIHSLKDLQGKRLIAVDPSSAGGYLFPWGLILEQGLRQQDFAEITFAPGPGGKQEKVVMAVYSGKYDVGTIREGTLNLLADKINLKEIRVLAQTKYYPGWLYTGATRIGPSHNGAPEKGPAGPGPAQSGAPQDLGRGGFHKGPGGFGGRFRACSPTNCHHRKIPHCPENSVAGPKPGCQELVGLRWGTKQCDSFPVCP